MITDTARESQEPREKVKMKFDSKKAETIVQKAVLFLLAAVRVRAIAIMIGMIRKPP